MKPITFNKFKEDTDFVKENVDKTLYQFDTETLLQDFGFTGQLILKTQKKVMRDYFVEHLDYLFNEYTAKISDGKEVEYVFASERVVGTELYRKFSRIVFDLKDFDDKLRSALINAHKLHEEIPMEAQGDVIMKRHEDLVNKLREGE